MELIYKDKLVYVFDDPASQDYARVTGLPVTTSLLSVMDCYFGRSRIEAPVQPFGLHLVLGQRSGSVVVPHSRSYTDMRTIEHFMDAHEALEPEHVVGGMFVRGLFKGSRNNPQLIGIVEPKVKLRR